MDLLEIPNLQRKSSEYILGLIKRHIFRVKAQQPLPPVWQRVQLFGVGDWWSGMCDPQAAFRKSAPRAEAVRLLLNHNPDPSEEEIREAISGQICRCTGYENIVRAVRWAATEETAT